MLDPTAAVIVSGENASVLPIPTVTVCTPEVEEDVVVVGVAEAVEVVEMERLEDSTPYCARANESRESKSGLLENCIFDDFICRKN
jgi:hypothetical protein